MSWGFDPIFRCNENWSSLWFKSTQAEIAQPIENMQCIIEIMIKTVMLDNSKIIIECAMAKTEWETNIDDDDDDVDRNNNTDNEQYQHLQYLCMNNDWIC